MKDCFTHIPQRETVGSVQYVVSLFLEIGITVAQLPRCWQTVLPVLQNARRLDGYVEVPLGCLAAYTHHHCQFCFALLGECIQRQIEGHPMGSAFSVFLQRAWSVFREVFFTRALDAMTLRTPGHRLLHVLLSGVWIIISDLRYADDISQTAVVPDASDIDLATIRAFLRQRRESRYKQIGGAGVSRVPGPSGVFIGLYKTWDRIDGIRVHPMVTAILPEEDTYSFDFACVSSLPHFEGWYHPRLPFATLCGFASRALQLSSTPALALTTLTDYLEVFLARASYPGFVIVRLTEKWDALNAAAAVRFSRAVSVAIARHVARQES